MISNGVVIASVNCGESCTFARSVADIVVLAKRPPELDYPEEQEEEQRHDDGELNKARAAFRSDNSSGQSCHMRISDARE